MSAPEASVVVPARDAAGTLPRLLEALLGAGAGGIEVVVVDNGSRDGTAEVAERGGARVVWEPRPSRALARNRGAATALSRRLLFCDADCVPEPGWTDALCACLERRPLAAGPVRLRTASPPRAVERFEVMWRFRQEEAVRDAGWAASANLAFRREAFEALGGFDPAYRRIGEDVDICVRAARAGLELRYCPEALVEHDAEARLLGVLARGARHGWSSTQHHYRLGGGLGRRYWRHPLPVVRGDWALRRFGLGPGFLPPGEWRRMLWIARAEYAARVVGSTWAELRRAR